MILRSSFFAAAALLATGTAFAQNTGAGSAAAAPAAGAAQTPPAPLTAADKPNLSYAIGYQIGSDMLDRKLEVDINAVTRALQDGFAKRKATVPEDAMHDVLNRMQYQMYAQAKTEFDKIANDNKAKTQKFLAENKGKKGIVSLPSGLQYQVIEDGSGTRHPTAESQVTVHFRISLISGLEMESSFARNQPSQYKVSELLKGWQEVLPLMKAGDYWRVFMPPEMAYGERGQPPRIGPNETIIIEIKLIDVK